MRSTCIAYNDDGAICGRTAVIIDRQRGGMVCEKHAPDRKPMTAASRARVALENAVDALEAEDYGIVLDYIGADTALEWLDRTIGEAQIASWLRRRGWFVVVGGYARETTRDLRVTGERLIGRANEIDRFLEVQPAAGPGDKEESNA